MNPNHFLHQSRINGLSYTRPHAFKTISVQVSGAITGKFWMPCVQGSIPFKRDLPKGGCYREKRDSFRDILNGLLGRYGGDFQNPAFTADTVVRIERVKVEGTKRLIHVWQRTIGQLKDCQDLASELESWEVGSDEFAD